MINWIITKLEAELNIFSSNPNTKVSIKIERLAKYLELNKLETESIIIKNIFAKIINQKIENSYQEDIID